MTITERISTIIETLPQDQASEILTFVEFVRDKHLKATSLNKSADDSKNWIELVNTLSGAWADDFPTLESIRVAEGQDIPRESF
jgi:hypothetical protein